MASAIHLHTTCSLKKLVDDGVKSVPPKYVFPSRLSVDKSSTATPRTLASPPVIDLAPLNTPERSHAISQIGDACRDYGFFQVVNHGISLELIKRLLAAADKFFALPAEDRIPYLIDDPRDKRSHSVNWKETVAFRSNTSAPAFCMEPAWQYKAEVQKLGETLYRAIVESLGATTDEGTVKQHVASCNMMMHYYPPCPDPSLTFGLSEHTDAGFITILLQDQVGGLEILKDGQWIPCNPVPEALTINIADQMEILSNGRYASILHRVVTNGAKPRLSVPCFLGPSMEAVTSPLADIIDENNPARFRGVVYSDYLQHYMKVRFDDTATNGLDFARL
ncbi:hypothetical protein KP509_12G060200 [Ceratopteris richardii]|uniref:Fe2OG dioxygenase domain-containing protein n=2 Tax=Ceratopteris richardii TaxID=49495 RepID=A0A8T2TLH4_CERRI|nr:hypothetical protein KP509_12G060200 [Ceratopteris richardii]